VADFSSHIASAGLPQVGPPLVPVKSFLGAPILHRGRHVDNLYLSDKEGNLGVTYEDEDMLVMFGSRAAMAIGNACRHREEQRAKANLETLIDAGTGTLASSNRKANRIVEGLRNPDQPLEELLAEISFRRAARCRPIVRRSGFRTVWAPQRKRIGT